MPHFSVTAWEKDAVTARLLPGGGGRQRGAGWYISVANLEPDTPGTLPNERFSAAAIAAEPGLLVGAYEAGTAEADGSGSMGL
jgi:hypothetical protein